MIFFRGPEAKVQAVVKRRKCANTFLRFIWLLYHYLYKEDLMAVVVVVVGVVFWILLLLLLQLLLLLLLLLCFEYELHMAQLCSFFTNEEQKNAGL